MFLVKAVVDPDKIPQILNELASAGFSALTKTEISDVYQDMDSVNAGDPMREEEQVLSCDKELLMLVQNEMVRQRIVELITRTASISPEDTQIRIDCRIL